MGICSHSVRNSQAQVMASFYRNSFTQRFTTFYFIVYMYILKSNLSSDKQSQSSRHFNETSRLERDYILQTKICGLPSCDNPITTIKYRVFYRRAGGRTPPEIDFSHPPEIFYKKRVFNFLTGKMACFWGKIPANFRSENFSFYPSPPGKKPEKKTCKYVT